MALASTATLVHQIRLRSSGCARIKEKVFRPNSRPKEDNESIMAPNQNGKTAKNAEVL